MLHVVFPYREHFCKYQFIPKISKIIKIVRLKSSLMSCYDVDNNDDTRIDTTKPHTTVA